MLYILLLFLLGIILLVYFIILLFGKTKNISQKIPKKKYCPLCGSLLQPGEPILAEMNKNCTPIKVFLKGCKHCYRNYKLPEKNFEMVDYGNLNNK